jgi:hypothetical protein
VHLICTSGIYNNKIIFSCNLNNECALLLSLMPRGRVAADKNAVKTPERRFPSLWCREHNCVLCFILINCSRAIPCRRIPRSQFRHESRAKTSRRIRLTPDRASFQSALVGGSDFILGRKVSAGNKLICAKFTVIKKVHFCALIYTQ